MCLIVLALNAESDSYLLLAANRDEFHRRPTDSLAWWADDNNILAGRDVEAGGTWLGVSRRGRFAAVTNYREAQQPVSGTRSRGELVTHFLQGDVGPAEFIDAVDGDRYAGFNLIVADHNECWYTSNRGDPARRLADGVYGLSNASLDAPWWKLVTARDKLGTMIESGSTDRDTLFELMSDPRSAPTGDISIESRSGMVELERQRSAAFIKHPQYGTRCTSIVRWSKGGCIELSERRFDAGGESTGDSAFGFFVAE